MYELPWDRAGQVNKRELHLCAEMCVSAGLYEEDNQWITQINRLQKLIDRLEKKATGYTNDFCLSHYKAFSLSVIVTVHTVGRNEEHADEDKLKLTVFNTGKAGQGKAGQGRAGQGKAGQGRARQGRALTKQTGTKIHRLITDNN